MPRRLAWWCVALSIVDGYFSLARAGHFVELNPMLRPLLQGRPFAFVAVKLVATLAGVWGLARSRAKLAPWLLAACVAGFGVIDAYWLCT